MDGCGTMSSSVTPVPEAQPATAAVEMAVACPSNVQAGAQLQVVTPQGQQLLVIVPEGVQPGQSFQVQVPSVQQPTLAFTGSPEEQALAASLAAAGGGIHLGVQQVQPEQNGTRAVHCPILNAAGAPINDAVGWEGTGHHHPP